MGILNLAEMPILAFPLNGNESLSLSHNHILIFFDKHFVRGFY